VIVDDVFESWLVVSNLIEPWYNPAKWQRGSKQEMQRRKC
jgi:hypothetical protein